MEIELKYNRSDFEEIYFSNNLGHYIKSSFTKKAFISLIISLLAFLFYFFMNDTQILSLPSIVFGLFFLYYLTWYSIKANKVRLRRKNVKSYLNKIETYTSKKLIISDESFTIKLDDEVYSENWSDILRNEVDELYFYLVSSKETYFIPKKSLTDEALVKMNRLVKNLK